MKKIRALTIGIFLLLLYACFAASVIIPDKTISIAENRELAKKPELTVEKLLTGKYQTQYEAYISDQFPLRDDCVALSSKLQILAGKRSINDVYIGKEGYLIEKNDENIFDEEQITENVECLTSFLNDAVEYYGSGHVACMMVPSKISALDNFLPPYADAGSVADMVADTLNSIRLKLDKQVLQPDLYNTMKSHEDEYIYYRTDHHWTTLGAYYAYNQLLEAMGKSPCDISDYERKIAFDDFFGTTYQKVHVKGMPDTVELFCTPSQENVHVQMDDGTVSDSMYFFNEAAGGFNRYNVFFSKNTFKIIIDTHNATGRTLLVIKDSFANCFIPFLTDAFDRIIMIDYRYGKQRIGQILDDNEDISDILVLFNTEKFMQNTDIRGLAEFGVRSKTMEEFNPEDFF